MSNEPPATPATAKGTRYVILKAPPEQSPNSAPSSSSKGWTRAGEIAATSAEAAIRFFAEARNKDGTTLDGSGTYVAIPERSWRPVTVTVEQTVSVKLG